MAVHLTDINGLDVTLEVDRAANTLDIRAGRTVIELDYDLLLQLITGLATMSDLIEDPDETP